MRSLRYYDMREYLGLRTHGPATLRISPLQRHVRHPWYALALLLIWTRDMDAAWLVSCVCTTLYLVAARGSKKTNSSPYGASFIVITAARCPARCRCPGGILTAEPPPGGSNARPISRAA